MTTSEITGVTVRFPRGVYADVRLERQVRHRILIHDGELDDVLSRVEVGAMLRVFKQGRWYLASTTDLSQIDQTLEQLASSEALPAGGIPDVDLLLEPHRARVLAFDNAPIEGVPLADKLALLRRPLPLFDRPSVRTWTARWMDDARLRRFLSSRGADILHDYQEAGFIYRFTLAHQIGAHQAGAQGAETLTESFRRGAHTFSELADASARHEGEMAEHIADCERFVAEAVPIEAGHHPVVLSPEVAGVFAHESFGHKSEADFMLGDPSMLDAWKIGTRVGPDFLSIVDDGHRDGSGYVPWDDEGQPARKTFLVRDGELVGRLHAAPTAAALDEACTGNARAMSFRYEPIVRMTTTYIEPGDLSRDALFAGVEDGYFIQSCKHGSGMSTFTIAPSLAWRIRGGKIAEPVRVAVITGTVFETLGQIDGLSDELEVPFLVGGGCGKFEQWPLTVGFGGPYVRIARMQMA